eukprot:TRINITY_DN5180_c0_g1_i1.p1 TRINITY_DN5180_c0_g1~~TRINITY_DN5180_c0_g1_i1.p1  ORF type:complete len:569 (+),score=118.38 TRINITY_DN5180_c0_g1_i1:50-1708(+)
MSTSLPWMSGPMPQPCHYDKRNLPSCLRPPGNATTIRTFVAASSSVPSQSHMLTSTAMTYDPTPTLPDTSSASNPLISTTTFTARPVTALPQRSNSVIQRWLSDVPPPLLPLVMQLLRNPNEEITLNGQPVAAPLRAKVKDLLAQLQTSPPSLPEPTAPPVLPDEIAQSADVAAVNVRQDTPVRAITDDEWYSRRCLRVSGHCGLRTTPYTMINGGFAASQMAPVVAMTPARHAPNTSFLGTMLPDQTFQTEVYRHLKRVSRNRLVLCRHGLDGLDLDPRAGLPMPGRVRTIIPYQPAHDRSSVFVASGDELVVAKVTNHELRPSWSKAIGIVADMNLRENALLVGMADGQVTAVDVTEAQNLNVKQELTDPIFRAHLEGSSHHRVTVDWHPGVVPLPSYSRGSKTAMIDLRAGGLAMMHTTDNVIHSQRWLSSTVLALGSDAGTMHLYDVRNMAQRLDIAIAPTMGEVHRIDTWQAGGKECLTMSGHGVAIVNFQASMLDIQVEQVLPAAAPSPAAVLQLPVETSIGLIERKEDNLWLLTNSEGFYGSLPF